MRYIKHNEILKDIIRTGTTLALIIGLITANGIKYGGGVHLVNKGSRLGKPVAEDLLIPENGG